MKLRTALKTDRQVKEIYRRLVTDLREDLGILDGIASNYPNLTASHIQKMAEIGKRIGGLCATIKQFTQERR